MHQGLNPPEVIQAKKAEVLENLKNYLGIITQACEKTGISRQTYFKWMKEDPDFAAVAEEVTERTTDFVEGKLFKKINEEDMTAIIFYLKSKAKKRGYGDWQKIELDGELKETQKMEIITTIIHKNINEIAN